MIEVSGLSKRFGAVTALDDVSFTVEKGQIVGFLGANGAGKTTTMDIICGCIGSDSGTAKISGFDITESPIEAKTRLGYLPDEPPLHQEMKVRDYIRYAGTLRKIPKNRLEERVNYVIERLEIQNVADRIIGNLSKGYRQRVALAQAIVHDPEVLVLDEPTEGLDPTQIKHIRELIRSLAPEHTIILSSHILSEVENTCDHIIIIHNGKVVRQGSYEALVDEMAAGKIYRLKVGHGGRELVGALANVPGVKSLQLTDTAELEFAFHSGEASLDQVARQVIDGGYGLQELALKTHSLEDVFFQISERGE